MAAWKCPKCGREFQREEQQHYCVKPKTVDEYIAAQEERVRPRLEALRSLLRETLPEAEERISWSMPTFWKGQNLIHFAAAKNHVGVYPGPGAVEAFKEELEEKKLKYSKGAIQFPYGRADLELIGRIAQWCGKYNA